MKSTQHDVAWAASIEALGVVSGVLMEAEHRDAIEEFYRVIINALKRYDELLKAKERRMNPLGVERG